MLFELITLIYNKPLFFPQNLTFFGKRQNLKKFMYTCPTRQTALEGWKQEKIF